MLFSVEIVQKCRKVTKKYVHKLKLTVCGICAFFLAFKYQSAVIWAVVRREDHDLELMELCLGLLGHHLDLNHLKIMITIIL